MKNLLITFFVIGTIFSSLQAGEVDSDWLYREYGAIMETLENKTASADEVLAGFIHLLNKNDRKLQADLALYMMQAFALRPDATIAALSNDDIAFRNWLDGLESLGGTEACGEGQQTVQRYASEMTTVLKTFEGAENKMFSAMANDLEEAIVKLRPHGMR
ncbi:MAG: hypothetical protein ACRBF0_12520 [Calditrichia bacterium]